jgi:hypothetical protein
LLPFFLWPFESFFSMSTTLVWFRNDLRVSDNPALCEAARRGAVVPVYVLDDDGGSAVGDGRGFALVAASQPRLLAP